MEEVQGSERTVRIELGKGAAVFIRACNTARGEIKAEGVVGMARSCFAAGAAATVVSLCSVDDSRQQGGEGDTEVTAGGERRRRHGRCNAQCTFSSVQNVF